MTQSWVMTRSKEGIGIGGWSRIGVKSLGVKEIQEVTAQSVACLCIEISKVVQDVSWRGRPRARP